jgi:hypothetical protein
MAINPFRGGASREDEEEKEKKKDNEQYEKRRVEIARRSHHTPGRVPTGRLPGRQPVR